MAQDTFSVYSGAIAVLKLYIERELAQIGRNDIEVVPFGTTDDVNTDDLPVIVLNRDAYQHEQISLNNNEEIGYKNGFAVSELSDIVQIPIKASVYSTIPAETEKISQIAYSVMTGVTRSVLQGYDDRFMGGMIRYWTPVEKSGLIQKAFESTVSMTIWSIFNTNIEIYGNISVKEIQIEVDKIYNKRNRNGH